MEELKNLLPKAVQTLVQPMQDRPENTKIDRARQWLTDGGWQLVGTETAAERILLNQAFEETALWLARFITGADPYWLVLIGVSGTGKTWLAQRIAVYIRKYAESIYHRNVASKLSEADERRIYGYAQEGSAFVHWRNLVPYSDDNRVRYQRARRNWVEIIDDLKPQTGREVVIDGEAGVQPERFEVDAAGDLLDDRLRTWTVITSNLTRSRLARFWDVRIASRLMRDGNTIVDLSDVEDFALRRERQKDVA